MFLRKQPWVYDYPLLPKSVRRIHGRARTAVAGRKVRAKFARLCAEHGVPFYRSEVRALTPEVAGQTNLVMEVLRELGGTQNSSTNSSRLSSTS